MHRKMNMVDKSQFMEAKFGHFSLSVGQLLDRIKDSDAGLFRKDCAKVRKDLLNLDLPEPFKSVTIQS